MYFTFKNHRFISKATKKKKKLHHRYFFFFFFSSKFLMIILGGKIWERKNIKIYPVKVFQYRINTKVLHCHFHFHVWEWTSFILWFSFPVARQQDSIHLHFIINVFWFCHYHFHFWARDGATPPHPLWTTLIYVYIYMNRFSCPGTKTILGLLLMKYFLLAEAELQNS